MPLRYMPTGSSMISPLENNRRTCTYHTCTRCTCRSECLNIVVEAVDDAKLYAFSALKGLNLFFVANMLRRIARSPLEPIPTDMIDLIDTMINGAHAEFPAHHITPSEGLNKNTGSVRF